MKFALTLSALWSKLANWWIRKLDDRRWAERLEAAYAIVPGPQAKTLLLNQVTWLRQASAAYGRSDFTQRDRADKLNNLVFLIAATAIKEQLELSKIVGVQPLTGPVGLAFRMTYCEKPAVEGAEPTEGKTLMLAVTKHPVEARTLKLQARIELERMQDANAISSGMAAEVTNAIGQEIAFENALGVVSDLRRLAMVNTLTVTPPEDASLMADTTVLYIQQAANKIGNATRRGVGNFVLGSPEALETLRASRFFTPKAANAERLIKLVGTLNNGTINVYELATLPANELLIGYNGAAATDTGYIFCPYVPLLITGPIADPQSFELIFQSMVRFSKHVVTATPEETVPLVVSSDYYALLKL